MQYAVAVVRMGVGYMRITEKAVYKDKAVEECRFSNRTYFAHRRNNIADVHVLIHKINAGKLKRH